MNRLAVASLVALPIGAAVAAMPAGASTGHANFRVVSIHALVSPAKTPNSNIVGNTKKAVYSPSSLKYKDTVGTCGMPNVSFTVSNTGTKTANISLDGTANFVDLPAGEEVGICSTAPAAEVDTFGLTNASGSKTYAGTLTVTAKN